ncbi:MAG: SulP family inorganic anion transporter [Proteobacteria bacterium]|nr:SulP family inorganic anion transporter [Pseudomonadota bacterium]
MDLAAGLLLAAIAVPEQVATAGLAGLPSVTGLIAFVAASIGFAIFGSSRVLSAGADSTIAPIIAGGLAAICSAGTAEYDGLASLLALMVGAILVVAALSRAGWIADLLSIPVTAGFLAGVSIHIAVAELPAAIGVPGGRGTVIEQLAQLEAQLPHLNTYALMIGLTAFLATLLTEKLAPRWPGALLAILLGGAAVAVFHLHGAGVLTAAALPPVGG